EGAGVAAADRGAVRAVAAPGLLRHPGADRRRHLDGGQRLLPLRPRLDPLPAPHQVRGRLPRLQPGVAASRRPPRLPPRPSFAGGWLLGAALLVNLLAAHLVRFRLSWKRSGILLIHSGIIVMMLGELVTGMFAIEGNMVIDQGASSNYVVHNRTPELAVVLPV